jgi:dTDP-glucose 4,6-dehydratase
LALPERQKIMKLFLTGSTGFVGRYVVDYFRNNTNLEVLCYDHDDLKNPISYELFGDFDYIINLASLSSVPESIKSPVKTVATNIAIAQNVFEFARLCHPKAVIHFSSVEADVAANPYGASKAAQEALATAYYHTYGVPLVIVTSHNIIGPNQSPDKFVPKIIEFINEGKRLQIYATNGNLGSRTYNTLKNVASALKFILVLLENPPTKLHRFLIDGGQELDNLAMARAVAKKLSKPLKYEIVEAAEVRPGYSPFLKDGGTPLSILGWKPPETLEEGLAWIQ